MFYKIVRSNKLKVFKLARIFIGAFFIFGLFIFAPTLGEIKIAAAATNLDGRILLQVQDKGQAYYIDPLDLKLYYLGRPADAFNLMRAKGLGITNADLAKIPISQAGVSGSSSGTISAPATSAAPTTIGTITPINFVFKYQNNTYQLTQNLSSAWYDAYKNSSKIYTYNGATNGFTRGLLWLIFNN